MADKQPKGSESLYAMELLSEVHGRTERRTKPDPYALKTPNAKSREAIHQARTGEGLVGFESAEDMIASLNDE